MAGCAEVQYVVLSGTGGPYLLARVRWPDVCQAISLGRPDWQDDPGLFDLPYDTSSVAVSLAEADAIAAAWGARLPSDPTAQAAESSLIRRMPANWSNLAPAEKRAWSLESVNTRPRPLAAPTGAAREVPASEGAGRRGVLAALAARLGLSPATRPLQLRPADANGASAIEAGPIDL